MTVRHVVLPIGAVLVLGLGVYLFVEVRAQPGAPPVDRAARSAPPPAPTPTSAAQPPAATPAVVDARASVPAPRAPAADPPKLVPDGPRDGAAAQAADPEPLLVGPKLDAVMAEANKAYDRGDFEDAKAIAGRVLARLPSNVRMLRIMVSASCLDGDGAMAQAHYAKLPPGDQEQMKVRCARYGIAFGDSP